MSAGQQSQTTDTRSTSKVEGGRVVKTGLYVGRQNVEGGTTYLSAWVELQNANVIRNYNTYMDNNDHDLEKHATKSADKK